MIAFSKYPELVCSIANIAVVSQAKEFDVVSFITVKRLENLLRIINTLLRTMNREGVENYQKSLKRRIRLYCGHDE